MLVGYLQEENQETRTGEMVLIGRFELPTSPLPRVCSTN
ncbi:protein of unknown function [Xenorhabdus nematophila AN6/1]|nr:hypothetical protein XNA1_3910001 [Xenorhabdus nematophila str. Anatoliense]CEE95826.1 hypothetical protein XNA1_70001 [Xenorhabdus nematophila str. Anatoliense]CEF34249.1 hypothetical protein XNW1_90001 [Xenorhabdus nematophila str. Websteri]CEK21297.1 protein of unknown function [Xenorhabdus nematophila AN6/1]